MKKSQYKKIDIAQSATYYYIRKMKRYSHKVTRQRLKNLNAI